MTVSTDATTKREMVDTNVLVYAIDADAGDKHDRARELAQRLLDGGTMALSAQILNEFYAAATRAHKPPSLPHQKAAEVVGELVRAATILPLTAALTLMALEAMSRHGFSFWDALVWAAAKDAGIGVLYTEDFQHGRDVEGVRVINPFLATGP